MKILLLNESDELFHGHGPAVEETLYEVAIAIRQEVDLVAFFNTLRDRLLRRKSARIRPPRVGL